VVSNFLASMDLELPMKVHMANALRDDQLYKWDGNIVVKIFKGIENAYKAKVKSNGWYFLLQG